MRRLGFGYRGVLALLLLSAGFGAAACAGEVHVSDTQGLATAIRRAEPGDTIILADGTYNIAGKIQAVARGEAGKPIVVRAEHRLKALIRVSGLIGFEINASYWEFRDLDMHGVCADDSECEHAFHVVGADGVKLVGNRMVDFNAPVKVNAAIDRKMPSDELIEGNEIFDTHPRRTANPVNGLNLDNANRWVIRGNFIYDKHKALGDQVSYAGYVKGGGEAPLFERNLVLCARKDMSGGTRVGLSLGGGGMAPGLCAPHWDDNTPCDPETTGGVIRNNLIANCSDVGIYLNRAKDTQVLFNTLVRTHGIDFRFPSSTGEAKGNVLAARINNRDDANFTSEANLERQLSTTFEAIYQNADAGDFRLKGSPAALVGKGGADKRVSDDFCGRPRKGALDLGALQSSLGDCATLPAP